LTSSAKINANRVNARASTGPKTQQGRARSAQNALRHGLSLPVEADPVLSEEIETLAREVAGPDANARRQECARHVAAAQIDLRRVRHARHQLLSRALRDPYFDSSAGAREKIRFISDLLRPNAPDIPIADLGAYLTATPQGPSKFAARPFRQPPER
jgi:hypothetical protein